MITIAYHGSGEDLSGTTQTLPQINSNNQAWLSIDLDATENDQDLQYAYISATIDWNDGYPPVTFDKQRGSIRITSTRTVAPGQYVVNVYVKNYRQPVPDTKVVTFVANVKSYPYYAVPQDIVHGPILPMDNGYPNVDQWAFNSGIDTEVIVSSIKMLLLTNIGDRIMLPAYGTNARKYLFKSNIPQNHSLVSDEVRTAIQLWEPRVKVLSVNVLEGSDKRSITINVEVVSILTNTTLGVSVNLVK